MRLFLLNSFVHYFILCDITSIFLVSISFISCVFNFAGVIFYYLSAQVRRHHAVSIPHQADLQISSRNREKSKGEHHRSGEAEHLGQEG